MYRVFEKSITFADGAEYIGQAREASGASSYTPFGLGKMTTKEGFELFGYFGLDGKHQGQGRFLAPNGDCFYGMWNVTHKRDGRGYAIKVLDKEEEREEDQKKQRLLLKHGLGAKSTQEQKIQEPNVAHYIEVYQDGALSKRIRTSLPAWGNYGRTKKCDTSSAAFFTHWIPPLLPLKDRQDQVMRPDDVESIELPCSQADTRLRHALEDYASQNGARALLSNRPCPRSMQNGGMCLIPKSLAGYQKPSGSVSPSSPESTAGKKDNGYIAFLYGGQSSEYAYRQHQNALQDSDVQLQRGEASRDDENKDAHQHRAHILNDYWLLDLDYNIWYPMHILDKDIVGHGDSQDNDSGTNRLSSPPPVGLIGHSITAVDNLVYVIGGQTLYGEYNTYVYIYDVLTGIWTSLQPGCKDTRQLSTKVLVYNHSATYMPAYDKIYVILHSKVFALCLSTHTWEILDNSKDMQRHSKDIHSFKNSLRAMSLSTSQHAAVGVSDRYIYVHGGEILVSSQDKDASASGFTRYISELRVFDVEQNTWSLVECEPPGNVQNGAAGNDCLSQLNPDDPSHINALNYVLQRIASSNPQQHQLLQQFCVDLENKVAEPAILYERAKMNGLIEQILKQTWDQVISANSRTRGNSDSVHGSISSYDTPRSKHSIHYLEQHHALMVFGGYSKAMSKSTSTFDDQGKEESGVYLNDVHVLDLTTMKWSTPYLRYPMMCLPRCDFGAIMMSSRNSSDSELKEQVTAGGEQQQSYSMLVVGGANAGSSASGLWDPSWLHVNPDFNIESDTYQYDRCQFDLRKKLFVDLIKSHLLNKDKKDPGSSAPSASASSSSSSSTPAMASTLSAKDRARMLMERRAAATSGTNVTSTPTASDSAADVSSMPATRAASTSATRQRSTWGAPQNNEPIILPSQNDDESDGNAE